MESIKTAESHKVHLVNRGNGTITGVVDVVSFDENEIVLETQMGIMSVKGKKLHVKSLSLESSQIEIDGEVDSIVYSNLGKYKKSKESLLGRMFK